MRAQLQCRGPSDEDWYILNTTSYPMGNEVEIRKVQMIMDSLQQKWSSYFPDHSFRVVLPVKKKR